VPRRTLPGLAPLLCGVAAALVLLWNLDVRYLWQDEAATAVLGERMLRYGRPLAYDGRNLVTMDYVRPEDGAAIDRITQDAESGVRFYVERGDFKPDTTWIGQPWGQFLLAGLSLHLLGHGTLQARLPFALAGVLAVVGLHRLVRRRFDDPLMAALAAALLLTNVFWILHTRQCRLYPVSSLLLLATLAAYLRWSDGGRLGAALLVASAWAFFQFDFGTFWPVVAVLGADALLTRQPLRRTAVAFGVLLVAIAPWVWYYELWGRLKTGAAATNLRVWGAIFNLNQFELPLVLVPLLVWLAWRAPRGERRLVLLCLGVLAALVVWVPVVAPFPYHRYLVAATPVAALLLAFAATRAAGLLVRGAAARALGAAAFALALAVSPVASNAVSMWIPRRAWTMRVHELGRLVRGEIAPAWLELSGRAPDPNRIVIEAVAARLGPDDEILVTYEDIPFMFYTDHRVRGGISAFRAEDRGGTPPRFAVVRRSVLALHWKVFRRELRRHPWDPLGIDAPDVPFANSPDPNHRFFPRPEGHPSVMLLERASGEDPLSRAAPRPLPELGPLEGPR
jgi:hypothetical protein